MSGRDCDTLAVKVAYYSLVVAQLGSFVVTGMATEGAPFEKAYFWVIVDIGLALVFTGSITLGAWYVSGRSRASKGFYDRGIYGYVRHPIYTGLITIALAYLVAGPTLLGGIAFLVVVATTNARAEVEERILVEKSPGYAEYRGRTKRFVPLVI